MLLAINNLIEYLLDVLDDDTIAEKLELDVEIVKKLIEEALNN